MKVFVVFFEPKQLVQTDKLRSIYTMARIETCVCAKTPYFCRVHHGAGICVHGKRRQTCVPCGGKQQQENLCMCGKRASTCSVHGIGSICQHGRLRRLCRGCGGASFCTHGKRKYICRVCSPTGNLWARVRSATQRVFRLCAKEKETRTCAVVGCSQRQMQEHINRKMSAWNAIYVEQMRPDNIHLDHIKPLASMTVSNTVEELAHFTNLQPLLVQDNARKKHKWSAQDERHWQLHISGNTAVREVYWPQACGALNAAGLEWGDLHVLACVAERMQRVA